MKVKAKDLGPGYFLVGDGRSRLYIKKAEYNGNSVLVHHHWGVLSLGENEEVEAARPNDPRPLPKDV